MQIHVRVKPGSSKEKVQFDELLSCWVIYIKAKPIDGQANKAIILYLSEVLKIPKSIIILLKGQNNIHKTIQINAPEKEILDKLSSML